MPPFIPLPDRLPPNGRLPTPPPNSPYTQLPLPTYGAPDIDLSIPLSATADYTHAGGNRRMSDNGYENGGGDGGYYPGEETPPAAGGSYTPAEEPSRKRPRTEGEGANGNGSYVPRQRAAEHPPPPPHSSQQAPMPGQSPLSGSIFNVSPRNPFTAVVGDWLLSVANGHQNIEIEIKLGMFQIPSQAGQPPRRINLPSLIVIPPDYPIGSFVSTLAPQHHKSLNNLLNRAVESQASLPRDAGRIYFKRSRLVDSFYDLGNEGGGKVRVSRDMKTGDVVESVRKRRVGDCNVYCPGSAYDLRISVNVEEPCEVPEGQPKIIREKDRACYQHQVCRVDLTSVNTFAKPSDAQCQPTSSFELEIEVLNCRRLLAEGKAQSDRFDEMLQNVLDSARMLVKNV
ncbi:hypothetical protein L198_04296 [Cryptococcus wingfieldii CBS 7118]|uniref:mRNA-capping enzyme subunit beta n=1 Tax=Cryptococcus wingfieldii CBS 7118 TaxID=1295528 RepID=A0A1E3J6U3_9TREE|nr:hypothetical protein L198_04296 [Cryptococcus wingfieldii CBS 7118]ODN96580.1 hypothetical protein L198_04296 [Cryptococcus wingfieldii CBS 7118]